MTKGFKSILLLIVLSITACGGNRGENESSSKFSREDQIKLQKYYVAGEQLYTIYCNNCHEDGKGLAKLIPPLKDSDYFAEDSSKLICVIKYGLSGSISVNGIEYNQPMPANAKLTNLEIATLTTYIYKEFQNRDKLILPNEVNTVLEACAKGEE